jgi:hypothetical protein
VESTRSSSRKAALSRLFWMFIGPAILSILGISLVEVPKGWLSPRRVVYLVLLIAVVLTRWFDPLDSYGQPTTPHHANWNWRFSSFSLWADGSSRMRSEPTGNLNPDYQYGPHSRKPTSSLRTCRNDEFPGKSVASL